MMLRNKKAREADRLLTALCRNYTVDRIAAEAPSAEEMGQLALAAAPFRCYEEQKKQPLRRGWRFAGGAALATISLIAVAFFFAAVTPNAVGTANQYLRRVAIWIGDTLQLNLTVDAPIEAPQSLSSGLSNAEEEQHFASQGGARAAYGTPLVEAGWLPEGVSFRGVTINGGLQPHRMAKYDFSSNETSITVRLEPLADETTNWINPQADSYTYAAGEVEYYITVGDEVCRASAVYEGHLVSVMTTFGKSELEIFLHELRIIR